MARLRDIPHVLHNVGPWTFTKRIYNQAFNEDNLLVWAAALAYSWLLALFPFLIFALSLVPLLPEQFKPTEAHLLEFMDEVLVTGDPLTDKAADAAAGAVGELASGVGARAAELLEDVPLPLPDVPQPAPPTQEAAPVEDAEGEADGGPDVAADLPEEPLVVTRPEAADAPLVVTAPDAVDVDAVDVEERTPAIISQTITQLVSDLINKPPAGLLTISLVVALFTASGGVAMTMAGLDKCYDVAPDKIRPVYVSRPLAMLLTIVLALLILLTVVVLPVGGRIISNFSSREVLGFGLTWLDVLTRVLRWVVGLLLLFSAIGLLYKFGPSVKTRLHIFSPGSVFTVVMWVLTAYGFQLYIDLFNAAENYARIYGAVAGIAILMLLFYLDALFLLMGAEINAEIDFIRLGIKSGPLPEEREVAPIPPYQLDEEDRELKAELEERRSIDIPRPPP